MQTRPLALAAFAAAALACAAGAHAAPCGAAPTYTIALPGAPFSAVATADEKTVFVSLNAASPSEKNGVAVLTCVAERYRVVRVIPLENQPAVMAMTVDERTLVIPDDSFVAFVDVARARSGKGDPIAWLYRGYPG